MKELCCRLGVKRNPLTAYHPQTDKQTEWVNQELKQYLRLYCNYRQNDWAEWLLIAEFSYNNWIRSSTGQSPFLVNLGCHPNMGQDIGKTTEDSPGTEEFLKTIREIRNKVEEALKKTNVMMKKKWDTKKKSEIKWKNGDLVWVDAAHYNTDQPLKKLSTKLLGPFPIIWKVGKLAYELKIPSTWKSIHPVINESYLMSYMKPMFEQQSQKSNNRVINPTIPTNVQEVEEILDSRWRGGKLQYLIKWRGQPLEERTGENRDEVIKGAPRLCKEFHQKHPDAPRVPTIQLPRKMYANITRTRS